ncbi:MAG: metal ABC transporter ATP-binding protein [Candidatus Nezhaarchaeota archaeon]|nr:metal ABC transporter ATP-binding protein [Candidatus Nezhaarchaeota archaeon]MCX8142293.1 metal ABC transporter ATP-binding protein [Candidatus Nezhaarchaeota archaeon]MDW8050734.1 metal ABC transporter ATP-binding protein [Nitrososphaerota archaeon]
MPTIYVRDLLVAYEDRPVLENVSFELPKPAFLSVIGPNASGKTTLLKALLGIVEPLAGLIEVLGYRIPHDKYKLRKLVGYVPQRERIDPTKPVLVKDVVLMGRIARRGWGMRLTREDYEAAKRALRAVEMEGFWDEPYTHLSGGQQQRVLIARALTVEPKLLLLDEPLSGVDAATQEIILRLLRKEADGGMTIIMVTHDLNPVMELSDYVMLLNKTVIAFGKVHEILNENLLAKTFMRRISILKAEEKVVVSGLDQHA